MKVARKILVPVDFSAASIDALEYAVALRGRTPGEIEIVHVFDPRLFLVTAEPYGAPINASALFAEHRHFAREQLAKLAAKLERRGMKVHTILANGAPHPVIVATAKKRKADLIVMSTHGRSGMAHFLLGSVAERVVRTAPCPVLLVRGKKA